MQNWGDKNFCPAAKRDLDFYDRQKPPVGGGGRERMLRRIRQWTLAPVHSTFLQVPRALVVSGAAAALDFGLLILLVEQAHLPVVAAAVLSYLVGGVLQYVLCSRWVFSRPVQHERRRQVAT